MKRRTACWLGMDAIDLVRADLRLDDEQVVLRHDHHDRLAGTDDAADRVHGRLVDGAVCGERIASLVSWSLAAIFRSVSSLIFESVSLSSLGDFAPHVLVDLEDLQFGLRDLGADLRRTLQISWPSWPSSCAAWRFRVREAIGRDELLLAQACAGRRARPPVNLICRRVASSWASMPPSCSWSSAIFFRSWSFWPLRAVQARGEGAGLDRDQPRRPRARLARARSSVREDDRA